MLFRVQELDTLYKHRKEVCRSSNVECTDETIN